MGLQYLGSKNNVSGYLANVDIFGTGKTLSPIQPPSRIVIFVCMSTSGVLTARRTCPAAVVDSEQLNGGTALTANVLYEFDYVLEAGETLDLRYSVNATILKIGIYEVVGETG